MEWQTKLIPAGQVRETIKSELTNIKGSIAVATSGGIDSSALVVSCLDLGYVPYVLSFNLDNKPNSYDFNSAKKLAKKFNLEFVPVILPSASNVILEKIIYSIRQFKIKKKTTIECIYPMLFVFDKCEELKINNLIAGHAADGHYGLSKKAMIHYRNSKESFQEFRKNYFEKDNVAQSETLKEIAAIKKINIYLPYLAKAYFDLFRDLSWFDINTPRQKELVRRDFPELDDLKLKNHLNLQLGDSFIAETIGKTVIKQISPTAKSPVTAYNKLWKQYAQA